MSSPITRSQRPNLYLPGPSPAGAIASVTIEAAIVPGKLEIVAERRERHVSAIRDEAQPQAIGKTERALDDVVVAVHEHRAPVAHVREHRQAGVDGAAQLIERRIGVSGGNDDAF